MHRSAARPAVNLGAGKNLLGTFHHPRAVLIDPEVLRTLPNREFRAGLYEALKCGIIGDLDLFLRFEQKRAQILKRDPVELEGLIAQSVKLKAEVVSADEREGGLRRVLNLGHTIGHALEAETGYRSLLHGEAVAWGMIAATNIALAVGRTDSVTAGRIADAVLSLGRLPELKVSARKILARLQADKKTQGGVVHFVLPARNWESRNRLRRAGQRGDRRGRRIAPPVPRRMGKIKRTWLSPRDRPWSALLRKARATLASAARAVREMFTSIAPRYDLLNHVFSFNVDRLWWRRTARSFSQILARAGLACSGSLLRHRGYDFCFAQAGGELHLRRFSVPTFLTPCCSAPGRSVSTKLSNR